MRHRSLLVLPLLAVAALVLGACGDDEASDETTTTAAEGGSTDSGASLEGVTLVNDGQLTVCSDMPYEPFEFQNADGETEGFDYDVVSAMGDQLGVSTEFVTTPFDGIIAALGAGNCDMIASAMTITEERAEQVDFTEPYFDADQSLLVLVENEQTYATLDDLAGKTIGVQSGTTGATYAQENLPEGATIKEFATGAEMFPALVSGEIDAALQDLPVNAYRATTAPDEFVVTETFTTGEQYGFAVTKDNTALLEALDTALATIREDGTYDEIYTEWFGAPKS
jgi:polar amino acid transport system substrate-binding protein